MIIANLLILLSALMLYPALLNADTSLPNTDAAQYYERLNLIALQPSPDMNEALQEISPAVFEDSFQELFQEIAQTSDAESPAAGTMIALVQQDPAEGGAALEKAKAESEDVPEEEEAESAVIADPLSPVNTVMFHFNDKLYFWGIKPVAQVYSHIVPETFRFAISNVYDNLWAPSRVLNNLFQLSLKAAGNELIRFVFNSFAGIGGMGDMANEALGIKKQEADFGQTLGHYGIGHGFYLVLPVFGPSSVREGIGLIADYYMHPLTYVKSSDLTFGEKAGISAHEKINDASFRIGDYETFKEAAVDPYISMRDAFVQNRKKKVAESLR